MVPSPWQILPDRMPAPALGVAAVGAQGTIVVIGEAICHAYAVDTRQWTELTPTDRFGCALVWHKDTVYVMGGYDANDNTLSRVQAIKPSENSMCDVPSMRTARALCAAVLLEQSKIVVFGGWNGTSTLNTVEMLDIHDNDNSNEWIPFPSMSQQRRGCAAAAIQDQIYVFGGSDASDHRLCTAEVLDVSCKTWTPLPDMPCHRSGGVALVVGHCILLVGGVNENDAKLDAVDCFDTRTHRWTKGPPLQMGRVGAAAAIVQDRVFVLGGWDQANNKLDTIETLDPYHTIVPKLWPLLQESIPLGLWPHMIARCPLNVVYFLLSCDKFQLDSVILHEPTREPIWS